MSLKRRKLIVSLLQQHGPATVTDMVRLFQLNHVCRGRKGKVPDLLMAMYVSRNMGVLVQLDLVKRYVTMIDSMMKIRYEVSEFGQTWLKGL